MGIGHFWRVTLSRSPIVHFWGHSHAIIHAKEFIQLDPAPTTTATVEDCNVLLSSDVHCFEKHPYGCVQKSVTWTSTFVTTVLQENRRRSDVTFLVQTFGHRHMKRSRPSP